MIAPGTNEDSIFSAGSQTHHGGLYPLGVFLCVLPLDWHSTQPWITSIIKGKNDQDKSAQLVGAPPHVSSDTWSVQGTDPLAPSLRGRQDSWQASRQGARPALAFPDHSDVFV